MKAKLHRHSLIFITVILMIAAIMSFHFANSLLAQGVSITRCLEFVGSVTIFVCAIFLFKDIREQQQPESAI
jgi:uncharacterized membrane-anchored protein